MNRINRYLLIISYTFICTTTIFGQTAAPSSPISSTATTQEIKDFTNQAFALNTQLADLLFKPQQPFSTVSSNEQAVATLYGALKLDQTIIHDAQVCYFLIEYLVKLELAAQFLTYYEQQKKGDVASLIVPSSSDTAWPTKQLQAWAQFAQNGQLNEHIKDVQAVANPDWILLSQTLQPALARLTWQQIAASDFWKSITISDPSILVNSRFWQNYTQYFLCTLLMKDRTLISSLTFSEKMLYPYIPTFQQSYYDDNFTAVRYSSELHRTQLALNDAVRDRALEQSQVWKNLPLEQVWQQAQLVMEKPFYKLLTQSTQNPVALMDTLAQKKSAVSSFLSQEEQQELMLEHPLLTEELLCIGMIKNLQARTYDIFSLKKLDATIQTLRTVTIRPTPNIMLFDYKEHAFLDDLNRMIDYFVNNKQLASAQPKQLPARDETGKVTSLWDAIVKPLKKEGTDFVDTFKSMGTKLSTQGALWAGDIVKASSDTWGAAGSGFNFLKYETQYAFTGDKAYQERASAAQRKANEEFQAAQSKYEALWKDSTDIIKTVGEDTGGAVLGFAAGGIDDYLGELDIKTDLKKETVALWKSTFDAYVDFTASFLHMLIFVPLEAGAYAAFYGPEFIGVATSSILGATIQSIKGDSSGWKEVGAQFEEVGAAMLTSFMSEVMFTVNQFLQVTKDVLIAAAYLAQLMAEIVLDIWKVFAKAAGAISHLVGNEETEAWFKQSSTTAEAYRSSVVAVANTVIIIGATIATDGLALGAIATNTAFQAPQIIGAIESDTQRVKDIADEQKLVKTYGTYVTNSQEVAKKQQQDWKTEQNSKFLEQIDNQERSLGFYQNFINTYYESIKSNMSEQLGAVLQKNLTPQKATSQIEQYDEYGKPKKVDVTYQFVPADVGALYGFNTGVYNLNPSQGLALYNKGRDAFSQEIAVTPALLDPQSKEITTRKFWFLQKETIIAKTQVQEYDVRFRAISLLDEFYVGLYCGGTPIDLPAIVKTGKADLDAAHLAKMCVFKREKPQDAITFDVYEHEGKGWYKAGITPPGLVTGTWYRLKAQLTDTTLQVKVYQEGSQEPGWTQLTVAKTDQSTYGIISSGAALEYQVLKPAVADSITKISKDLRPPLTSTVAQKEKTSRLDFNRVLRPDLPDTQNNIFKLAALDTTEILKGNYIYTSPATGITQEVAQLKEDYVLVCEITSNNLIQTVGDDKRELIGINPEDPLRYPGDLRTVISLISDKQFEPTDGTWALSDPNNRVAYRPSLNAYLKNHPSVSDATRNKIAAARKLYNAPLLQPFTFGTYTLTPTSPEDVDARIFVYRTTSPNKALRNANIQDYMIMTRFDDYKFPDEKVWGLPIHELIPTPTVIMFSLVTGYWYEKGSDKPYILSDQSEARPLNVAVDAQSPDTASLYESYKDAGRTALLTEIGKAQQVWQAAEQVQAIAKEVTKALATATTQATQEAKARTTTGKEVNPQPDTNPAQKSITQQSQEAASTSGF